jgi:hypothetical protein
MLFYRELSYLPNKIPKNLICVVDVVIVAI